MDALVGAVTVGHAAIGDPRKIDVVGKIHLAQAKLVEGFDVFNVFTQRAHALEVVHDRKPPFFFRAQDIFRGENLQVAIRLLFPVGIHLAHTFHDDGRFVLGRTVGDSRGNEIVLVVDRVLYRLFVLRVGKTGRKTRPADKQGIDDQCIPVFFLDRGIAFALFGGPGLGHVDQVLNVLGIILLISRSGTHFDFAANCRQGENG